MTDDSEHRRPVVVIPTTRRLIIVMLLSSMLNVGSTARSPVMCLQCGGDKYEGSVKLSREICCKATPIQCLQGQVCLRALVYSPYGNFFLSGCHPEEDHLSGCDYHSLPHNSSVHRCVCKDSECQNSFPGDCPIKGITELTKPFPTTTLPPHSSTPPSLLARNRTRNSNSARNRHHHSHSMTSDSGSSATFTVSSSSIFLLLLSAWVATFTVL